MAVADKIIALLDTLTRANLDSLSPVRRRQFADLCRHWADIAERLEGAQQARDGTPGREAAAAPAGSANDAAMGRAPAGDAGC
jgi:hypothetical protein